MRGTYVIVAERTTGDRFVCERIDIEGLPTGSGDPLGVARERADATLARDGIYQVIVYHETGDYVLHASRKIGQDWRLMNEGQK